MSHGDTESDRPSSSFEGTYAPGIVLAARYRVVALIGEGGMGEVYLADDLTLEQEVALKFLPEHIAERADGIERFRREVRVARQVTHPNVARVHDIGEVDGRPFLSMEYVDGDDLSQLLKRIGRLPKEKAVDVAQQMCAGLAAAHERDVLHRDLKPANVMMDGEGRLKITDFGLAAAAADRSDEGVVMGTPAYMSPEQITGGTVTERSEVYSLGLVLYELFTGRRAFEGKTLDDYRRLHAQETPSSPSSILADIDPVAERVIMRCLEKDPAQRPPSVRAVALALPGGDPLAAAVAAGETPGVELVAEAGARGGLSVRAAVAWLACFAVGLVASLLVVNETQLTRIAKLESSPEVLATRARDILERIGDVEPAADSVTSFWWDEDYLAHIEATDDSPDRWDRLADARPPTVRVLYRQSPTPLMRIDRSYDASSTTDSDPPHDEPGMVRMWLDPEGHLLSFSRVSPRLLPPPLPEAFDWGELFGASGLDAAAFEPVAPSWTPDVHTDAVLAWEGPYADTGLTVRVEAGSAGGRPVSWRVIMPWERGAPVAADAPSAFVLAFSIPIAIVLLGGGVMLARRNVRLGRCDRKGAFRLAVFMIVVGMLQWLLGEHHLAHGEEFPLFFANLGGAVWIAMIVWIAYLALEPFIRRLWPQRIVSWVRLLDGNLRDPLVGRDLLLGGALGMFMILAFQAYPLSHVWLDAPSPRPDRIYAPFVEMKFLLGGRHAPSIWLGALPIGLFYALVSVVFLVLLRLLLRRQWLAVLVFLVLSVLIDDTPLTVKPFAALHTAVWLFAFLRFGLLAAVTAQLCFMWTGGVPVIPDPSRWYFTESLVCLAVAMAIPAWGFYTSLAGRPLFADPLQEEGGAGHAGVAPPSRSARSD